MAHQKPVKPSKVDPRYLKSSYNLVRCGVCGVPWDEHLRNASCNRYRPPDELVAAMSRPVAIVVVRNLRDPCTCHPQEIPS